MRIGATVPSYLAYNPATNDQQLALLRTTTAQRIDDTTDDSANLAIAETMGIQVSGLNQSVGNIQDAAGLPNTANHVSPPIDSGQPSGLFLQSQIGMYAAMMALSKSIQEQQGTLSLLV